MLSYIYLTKVAVLLGNGSNVVAGTIPRGSNMSITDYNNLNGRITSTKEGNVNWTSTNLGVSGNPSMNSTLKKMFVFGMALHSATDVLAHSTWEDSGSSYTRIAHTDQANGLKKADDPNYKPTRYNIAEQIAKRVVERIHNAGSANGTIFDFAVTEGHYDNSFYVGNYDLYAETSGSNLYETYKSRYKKADLYSNTDINP